MTPVLIRGRLGLGDNIYQRSIVRELVARHDVYLETPWPQLVRDLPIKCLRRPTVLRTQTKNAARADTWYRMAGPTGVQPTVVAYAGQQGTMLAGLCATAGIDPAQITFDLPAFAPSNRLRPYIVVRPATIRREWPSSARNPLPEYLATAAHMAREQYEVVSVADLVPKVEWALDPLPPADVTLHKGELNVEELMALVAGAAGVIGGVGWLVPAACAYRVPLLLFYGGCGQHDGPARIFDPRMPTENVTHALPEKFCLCGNRRHACDKRITGVEHLVRHWLMGLHASGRASMVA